MPPETNPCFAAKSILFRIPFHGAALKHLGSIKIDRNHGKRSMQRLRDAVPHSSNKKSLALIPEGTRSEKSQLRPFKKGAFILARGTETRLLPLFISGTADIMPIVAILPGSVTIKVKVLPPVTPSAIKQHGVTSCSDTVKTKMQQEYA